MHVFWRRLHTALDEGRDCRWRGGVEVCGLCRSVDSDVRIDLQHLLQTARMVAMTMREHDEIEPCQIDAKGVRIAGEIIEVATGVEKNASATVFDESRVSPAALEFRGFAEGVVDDRYARR